jgi:coenzyme PQQ precursor peptide PqqA
LCQSVPLPIDFGTAPALWEASSGRSPVRLGGFTHIAFPGRNARPFNPPEGCPMKWTKPEAEIVAVTMEVTAYVSTL